MLYAPGNTELERHTERDGLCTFVIVAAGAVFGASHFVQFYGFFRERRGSDALFTYTQSGGTDGLYDRIRGLEKSSRTEISLSPSEESANRESLVRNVAGHGLYFGCYVHHTAALFWVLSMRWWW